MRAVIWTAYGAPEVLQLQQIEKPTPKDDQILVKVHASTVTSGDARLRALNVPPGFTLPVRIMFGLTKPRQKPLGSDFAGVVEAVGSNVTEFAVGDAIFGATEMEGGSNAEYIVTKPKGITHKPENVSFAEAAAAPFGAITAIQFLRDKGQIQSGHKLLINGASGACGVAAIQIAKHYGAEVTAICSGANADLVRSLGADHVIDYTKTDVTRSNEKYDLILETVGKLTYQQCKPLLKPGGKMLALVGGMGDMIKTQFRKDMEGGTAMITTKDVQFLSELMANGDFVSIIDSRYPLEETAEAHRRVDTGRKRGNVVIEITK